MSIGENVAQIIKRVKTERNLSMAEMAEEFGIAKSQLEVYITGAGNPRADTLELLADKIGVSVSEIISAQHPGWERAEIAERAARVFSSLPPEKRDRAISHFLSLVEIFSDNHT